MKVRSKKCSPDPGATTASTSSGPKFGPGPQVQKWRGRSRRTRRGDGDEDRHESFHFRTPWPNPISKGPSSPLAKLADHAVVSSPDIDHPTPTGASRRLRRELRARAAG